MIAVRQPMSDNAHEELYRTLLIVADEAPIGTVANCIEVMSTVLNRRLTDLRDASPERRLEVLAELGY